MSGNARPRARFIGTRRRSSGRADLISGKPRRRKATAPRPCLPPRSIHREAAALASLVSRRHAAVPPGALKSPAANTKRNASSRASAGRCRRGPTPDTARLRGTGAARTERAVLEPIGLVVAFADRDRDPQPARFASRRRPNALTAVVGATRDDGPTRPREEVGRLGIPAPHGSRVRRRTGKWEEPPSPARPSPTSTRRVRSCSGRSADRRVYSPRCVLPYRGSPRTRSRIHLGEVVAFTRRCR
jgi:hypothetical protein